MNKATLIDEVESALSQLSGLTIAKVYKVYNKLLQGELDEDASEECCHVLGALDDWKEQGGRLQEYSIPLKETEKRIDCHWKDKDNKCYYVVGQIGRIR